MKHIVLFSGGAASSYVAWLVAQHQDKKDIVLLHTPTFSEDRDADRFRCQVARYLDLPITVWGDGRDIWQIIDDNNCLPSNWIPFCTRILKQEMSDGYYKYLKSIGEEFILYFGYGAEEWRRIQKQTVRFEVKGIKAKYPIFEKNIPNEEVKRIIREEWKICLPNPYIYLEHNNCIPCFKGGKGHFRKVAKYYPENFKMAIEKEKLIGHTVFKDCTLQDIWDEVEADKENLSFLDDLEGIPCLCSV